MAKKKKDREASLKRKYGADCFEEWGKLGGSPILKAYKQGKLVKRR